MIKKELLEMSDPFKALVPDNPPWLETEIKYVDLDGNETIAKISRIYIHGLESKCTPKENRTDIILSDGSTLCFRSNQWGFYKGITFCPVRIDGVFSPFKTTLHLLKRIEELEAEVKELKNKTNAMTNVIA
ncbi:MAG: hypothetical protein Q8O30_08770 [Candidatus Omnitrophota bacterium]|nr:hypothetical protein [Candidatus Omnitrophota bacterium]